MSAIRGWRAASATISSRSAANARVEVLANAIGDTRDHCAFHVAGGPQLGGQRQDPRQILCHDRRDDGFLVVEVVVDVAGAHAGSLGDLRDARAVKSMAAEAIGRRGEDLRSTHSERWARREG